MLGASVLLELVVHGLKLCFAELLADDLADCVNPRHGESAKLADYLKNLLLINDLTIRPRSEFIHDGVVMLNLFAPMLNVNVCSRHTREEWPRSRQSIDVSEVLEIVWYNITTYKSSGPAFKLKDADDIVSLECFQRLLIGERYTVQVLQVHVDHLKGVTDHTHSRQTEDVLLDHADIGGVLLVIGKHRSRAPCHFASVSRTVLRDGLVPADDE